MPFKGLNQLGGLWERCQLPSGVRGRAPAENEFGAHWWHYYVEWKTSLDLSWGVFWHPITPCVCPWFSVLQSPSNVGNWIGPAVNLVLYASYFLDLFYVCTVGLYFVYFTFCNYTFSSSAYSHHNVAYTFCNLRQTVADIKRSLKTFSVRAQSTKSALETFSYDGLSSLFTSRYSESG